MNLSQYLANNSCLASYQFYAVGTSQNYVALYNVLKQAGCNSTKITQIDQLDMIIPIMKATSTVIVFADFWHLRQLQRAISIQTNLV